MSWSSAVSYGFTHPLTFTGTFYCRGGAFVFGRLIDGDADAGPEECDAKRRLPPIGLWGIYRLSSRHCARNSHIGGIRSRGAGGERCNRGDRTGSNGDFATVVINDGGAAAGANHDRVADI